MRSWPLIPLDRLLHRSSRWVVIDPDREYQQITVRLWGKGVVLRGICKGADIAAPQQVQVQAGQFIMSRIDARHGAFGLVPSELDGAVVSGDFPCFDVDQERLLPDFMSWLSKTEPFIAACKGASEGSTNRVRLKEDRFLASEIQLPPLPEQHQIVERLNSVSDRLSARQSTLQDQQRDLDTLLRAAFVRITADAPKARMGDIAPLVRRPVDVQHDRLYPELGIRSFGRGTFHKPAVAGSDVGSKRLFAIEPGDLLFSNVFAWEGAVAIASPDDGGRVGSHRFMTCVADQARISAEMLRFFFLTSEGLKLLGDASPGGAGRNRTLGLAALERIEVPVPPKDAQIWFDQLHTKIRALRAQHTAITTDCDALLPAMLNEIFR